MALSLLGSELGPSWTSSERTFEHASRHRLRDLSDGALWYTIA